MSAVIAKISQEEAHTVIDDLGLVIKNVKRHVKCESIDFIF